MLVPASTSLPTVGEPTLSIDTPEVVPHVTRFARLLFIIPPVVAAEHQGGVVDHGEGPSCPGKAVAALVGEEPLGYVSTVGRKVSYG
jgi:hypothetical protein